MAQGPGQHHALVLPQGQGHLLDQQELRHAGQETDENVGGPEDDVPHGEGGGEVGLELGVVGGAGERRGGGAGHQLVGYGDAEEHGAVGDGGGGEETSDPGDADVDFEEDADGGDFVVEVGRFDGPAAAEGEGDEADGAADDAPDEEDGFRHRGAWNRERKTQFWIVFSQ